MLTDTLIKTFIKDNENTRNKKVRQAYGYLSGTVGVVVNITLFTVKIVIGLLTNSIAVTADAVNNLSDAASSIITLVGFKMTSKPADREHPFGHGRIEYIAAMIISFMVMLVGFEFFRSSVDRIRNPIKLNFDITIFVILMLSVALKVWLGRFYTRIGKTIGSKVMEATAADSLSDVVTTSVVAFSLLASRWIAFPIDGYIGLLVALFIMYAGFSLIKDTLDPLLGDAPEPELIREITEKTLKYEGIIGIHDMIVHNYGPGRCVVSLHAEIPAKLDIMKAHDIVDRAESEISEELDIHMVIHMDPINTDDKVIQATQAQVVKVLKEYPGDLSIHDFRIVGGEEHKNLIFDLVVPHEFNDKEARELSQNVAKAIKNSYPNYNAVITIDRAYSILNK